MIAALTDSIGRGWRIEVQPVVVGFRYEVTIIPVPEPVAHGWSEGYPDDAEILLAGIMRSMGAVPTWSEEKDMWIGTEGELARLPGPLSSDHLKALRTLVSRARAAMLRECQKVAQAVESGRITTSRTVGECLALVLESDDGG